MADLVALLREGAADCGRGVSGAGHGRPRRPRSPPARPQPSSLNPGGLWSGLVPCRACPLPRRLAFIPARCSPRGWGQHLPTPSPAPPGPRAPALSPPASLRWRGRSPAGSREPTAELRDPPAPKSLRASPSPPHRGGWMPRGGPQRCRSLGRGLGIGPAWDRAPPEQDELRKPQRAPKTGGGPASPSPGSQPCPPGGGGAASRLVLPRLQFTLH